MTIKYARLRYRVEKMNLLTPAGLREKDIDSWTILLTEFTPNNAQTGSGKSKLSLT